MATAGETVWAIDIGSSSLKALHLSTERGVVEVIGFDNIPHGKILSSEGMTAIEREELVALSLRKFVNRHDVSLDEIVVSVPGQNSFARFVNLPPVEQKRIPEIVKFEAVQQIPFDINDVQWDWQLMSEPDASELKVGLFAIKNEIVNAELERYNREDIPVGFVQMAPMALYNYLAYDRADLTGSDNKATVVINIGASGTDLVVCTRSSVWQRGIMIGGNTFTQAIADTFRLDFVKAEKLKHTAPVSKYARQLFQAMRPVYTDFASEVQQSLGFFSSSNPNTKVSRVIALGGGTKLRGLLKYLQQTLQIPVERPDAFKRLAINPQLSAAKFHENVCNFGVVYGLGLQGLGLANVESNLLPTNVARSMAWASKGRYFIVAACMLLGVSLLCLGRTAIDSFSYKKGEQDRKRVSRILSDVDTIKSDIVEIEQKRDESVQIIDKQIGLYEHREVIPKLHELIFAALPNEKNNPSQAALYKAFAAGDVDTILRIPRKERAQMFITNMAVYYTDDIAGAKLGSASMWRTTRGTPSSDTGRSGTHEISPEEYEMMMMAMRTGQDYDPYSPFATGSSTEEKKGGFVISVAGFSPYEENHIKFRNLLEPPGVEDKPDQWGFITRLMHLDNFYQDSNSPFELFGKGNPEHFSVTTGEVGLGQDMPSGIGVMEPKMLPAEPGQSMYGDNVEWMILDPLTREVINQVQQVDNMGNPVSYRGQPSYIPNDHWFVINMKFVWNTTGKAEDGAASTTQSTGRSASTVKPKSSPTRTSTTSRPNQSKKKKSTPTFDDI